MLVRMMLAVLTTFSVQQIHAVTLNEGDQSGLLADLYHSKNDYHNVMTKGMIENNDLMAMMRKIHTDLSPYVDQQVMMGFSWSSPIWQTTADFRVAFAEENRALGYALDTLDLKAIQLAELKRMGCEHLNPRFEALRYDMRALWQSRDIESRVLINELEEIAEDADRADGAFTVRASWLNEIAYRVEVSERNQLNHRSDFTRIDQSLGLLFEDIRTCYNID